MFASTEDSIHAHFNFVFAALAISRYPRAVTGVNIRRIIQALRTFRDVTISIDGHELTSPTPADIGEVAGIVRLLYP